MSLSKPSITRRDFLECIRACHPKAQVMKQEYYSKAKMCLHRILPSSNTSNTDMDYAYTARRFVDDVRERWKKSKRYSVLKITQIVTFQFSILAFSIDFYPIKIDLSGNST